MRRARALARPSQDHSKEGVLFSEELHIGNNKKESCVTRLNDLPVSFSARDWAALASGSRGPRLHKNTDCQFDYSIKFYHWIISRCFPR